MGGLPRGELETAVLLNQNQRLKALRTRVNEIEDELLVPFREAQSDTFYALTQAQNKLDAATAALAQFPTTSDYLGDFSPAPIDKTVTDANGDFTIQHPESGAKVFAKAQRQVLDSVENYFWLVDLPTKSEKLVLSNNNMFNVPTKPPP